MKKPPIDFGNLNEKQLDEIKSLALGKYLKGGKYSRSEVFNVECFMHGLLNFLNANGYEIKEKAVVNEQQVQSKESNEV